MFKEEKYEYIGSGVSFFFQRGEDIFHVIVTEKGFVGVYKGETDYKEFTEWGKFKEEYPEFERVVTDITSYKLRAAIQGVSSIEVKAAIDDVNRYMYT